MRFSALILKNLTRRPLRAALTLIALTMAVASVVALRGIAKGFTESFAAIYESHSIDIVVSRQGTADRLSSSVSEEAVGQIERLDGVARAAGVLLDTLSLEDQQIFGVPTMGIAADSCARISTGVSDVRPRRLARRKRPRSSFRWEFIWPIARGFRSART